MNLRTFVAVLCLTSVVGAQTPPLVSVPPGEDKIVPLKKGQSAPFDGQLYDPDTALRWANWLEQCSVRLELDVRRSEQLCITQLSFKDQVYKIEKKRSSTVEKDLKDRLTRSEKARLVAEDEARNPPWYRSVWFGVAVGVVSTTLIATLSVVALNSAK